MRPRNQIGLPRRRIRTDLMKCPGSKIYRTKLGSRPRKIDGCRDYIHQGFGFVGSSGSRPAEPYAKYRDYCHHEQFEGDPELVVSFRGHREFLPCVDSCISRR